MTRPLHVIADDINASWPHVSADAVNYVRMMRTLDTLDDVFVVLTGAQIVRNFIAATARGWRASPDARRLRAELVGMLDAYDAARVESLTTEQEETRP